MKSLQWQQNVGCLKNLGMNLWSLTSDIFFFFKAPFLALNLKQQNHEMSNFNQADACYWPGDVHHLLPRHSSLVLVSVLCHAEPSELPSEARVSYDLKQLRLYLPFFFKILYSNYEKKVRIKRGNRITKVKGKTDHNFCEQLSFTQYTGRSFK